MEQVHTSKCVLKTEMQCLQEHQPQEKDPKLFCLCDPQHPCPSQALSARSWRRMGRPTEHTGCGLVSLLQS